MKKFLTILLAAALALAVLGTAALADSYPQPEGGKKFESSWALGGGLIQINYEEEGYRVYVELLNNEDLSGTVWEYSCYYQEDTDCLMSISSVKFSYSTDPVTGEQIRGEDEYAGIDEDSQNSLFSIAENGALIWTDGHENTGVDLEFRNIGDFEGVWRSAEGEEPVSVSFHWQGLDQEEYHYSVILHRGDDDTFTEFTMTGLYDEETAKLVCSGTAVSYTRNAEGLLEETADNGIYEAFFSRTEDGKLLYEAGNGIVLEYDFLGDVENG